GKLPDGHRSAGEAQVAVQAEPGVVRQGLVDLEGTDVGHLRPPGLGTRSRSYDRWGSRGSHGATQDNPRLDAGATEPMPTEAQVRQALRQVLDPEIGKPIEDLGMLQGVLVDDGTVTVQVLLTVAGCPLKERIDRDVRAAVAPLEGVRHVD